MTMSDSTQGSYVFVCLACSALGLHPDFWLVITSMV